MLGQILLRNRVQFSISLQFPLQQPRRLRAFPQFNLLRRRFLNKILSFIQSPKCNQIKNNFRLCIKFARPVEILPHSIMMKWIIFVKRDLKSAIPAFFKRMAYSRPSPCGRHPRVILNRLPQMARFQVFFPPG